MASNSNSIIRSSSSSSSSSAIMAKNHYYDVFVSFRGEDTRHNLTDHLFAALKREGIFAFRDDTNLRKGDSIAPELFLAIQGSQIFIVVFSKNYASSTWCLRELEYILKCAQVSKKRVLPVFYDVEPSVVGKQSGSYAEAFDELEERFKQDLGTVLRWREALTQVAKISGWEIGNKPQYARIEEIVNEVMNTLGHKFSVDERLPKSLIGMESPIVELETHLLLDSRDDVRVLGICGMGGIGKTALATALNARISHQFDFCVYIEDMSKVGRIGAQKQILHQALGQEHLQIDNLYRASNVIRSRLRRLRALITLDNVDKVDQVAKLGLHREWLGAGSRIIIISRDEHILKAYGVDAVHKVQLLNGTDSGQLFSQKAFKLDHIISSYEELAYDVLDYTNGLPLAIEVLGSFLFGRDVSVWKSALARLRESPNKDIMDVLRLSLEGLEKTEKDIFLDIACFFNGEDEDYVKRILDCCGFHPDIGLSVLIDKSLISIEEKKIKMHNLLVTLGRKIVQENSSEEPKIKWSRLWSREHFYNVVLEHMEKNVEALIFKEEMEKWMVEALSKMSHLRLLVIMVDVSGSLDHLSNELRYVQWFRYPFMCLPTSFQPTQLVELKLGHSSIEQLWIGKKYLPKLKTLDLNNSKNLLKMPNFGEVPNLERLNLEGCVKLMHINSSIGVLRKLVRLNLRGCSSLTNIPNNIFGLSSLAFLDLSGCSKVFNHPRHWELENESALHSQSTLSYLRDLDISFCKVRVIPDAIACLRLLEDLNLGGNEFVSLPSLKELSRLVVLNLEHCKYLESLPELPSPPALKRDRCRWNGEIYVFNCPKLGEWERCSNMVFSWMIQFIRANQQSYVSFREIKIVIPGNEIPKWFDKQKMGGSINMDISPIMHDSNIIGVACCGVFSIVTTETAKNWEADVSLCFQRDKSEIYYCYFPLIFTKDVIRDKSDHLFLVYLPREKFFDCMSDIHGLEDITLEACCWHGQYLELDAKTCGYHWVFKQDLHPRNSIAWNHNFLALEEGEEDLP